MNPTEIVWRHPRQAYELAYVLKNDRTNAYEEYAAALRENIVSLEDQISKMQEQIDALWVAAGL
jgi:prefoldin subunit 5